MDSPEALDLAPLVELLSATGAAREASHQKAASALFSFPGADSRFGVAASADEVLEPALELTFNDAVPRPAAPEEEVPGEGQEASPPPEETGPSPATQEAMAVALFRVFQNFPEARRAFCANPRRVQRLVSCLESELGKVYPTTVPEAIANAARGVPYPEEVEVSDLALLTALLKLTELLDFHSAQVQGAIARSTVPARLFRAYWDVSKPPVTVIPEPEEEEDKKGGKDKKGKASDKGKDKKGKGKGKGEESAGGAEVLGGLCGTLLTRLRGESALVGLGDAAAEELVRLLRDEVGSVPEKAKISLNILGKLLKQTKGDRLQEWLLSKAPMPFPKPVEEEDPKAKKPKGKAAEPEPEPQWPPVVRTPVQVLVDMVAPPPVEEDPADKGKKKGKDEVDPEAVLLEMQLLALEIMASFVEGSQKAVEALDEAGLWKLVDDSLRAWVPPPPEDPKDKKKKSDAGKSKKKGKEEVEPEPEPEPEPEGPPTWSPQPARVKEAAGPPPPLAPGQKPGKGEEEPGYFPPLRLELAMLHLLSVAVFADPDRAWSDVAQGSLLRAEELVVQQEKLLNIPRPPEEPEPEDPKAKKAAEKAKAKKSAEEVEAPPPPFDVPVTSAALEALYMMVMVDPRVAESVCSREETLKAVCGVVRTAEHPTVTQYAVELLTFFSMMGPGPKEMLMAAGAGEAVAEAIKHRSRHDRFVLECLANAKLSLHFL